jgi:filamentous hemagglutinin
MTTVPYTFGNEESPIPLSQLDANFAVTPQYANTAGIVINPAQANITSVGTLTSLSVSGNVVGSRFTTAGTVTAQGNVTAGNIVTGGQVNAFGAITADSFSTAGNVTGSNINGTIVASNITASGTISAVGNISTQSEIVAIGNVNTSGYFIGNFLGNIVGNITGAPGSATQVLFNTAGNVDAVGGLTYNKGSNVLTVLGQVSTQTLAVSGLATAPTAPNATSNNQIASTAFVNNQINQYANAVAITAGNIAVTNLTANTVTTGLWTIQDIGGVLYFQHTGGNVAKLESNGDFTTIGNVTGFGTV